MNGTNSNHFINLPHWQYPVKLPGLSGLYLNTVFRVLAIGLIGVFVPVYIFQTTGSWDSLIFYYLVCSLTTIGLVFPIAKLIKKIGPDAAIAIGAITQFANLILLIKLQDSQGYLFWAAILSGVTTPLHWQSYHLAFSQECTRKKLTSQLAKNAIAGRVSSAVAPLLGGIIATIMGFSGLYLVAGAVLIISIIPIFFDQYNQKGSEVTWQKIKTTLQIKKLRPCWFGYFGSGIESAVYTIFWPLFLYFSFKNLEKIGLLSTISIFISILVTGYIGKNGHRKEKKFFNFGLAFSLPSWLIRSVFSSFFILTFIDAIYLLTTQFIWIPVEAITYRWGRKEARSFFILRSIMIQSGLVFALLVIYFFRKIGFTWQVIFPLGIFGLAIVKNFSYELKEAK
jgi:hypothetical protein